MHGEWTRKLHKISIYSPTNAHYYMTDIRLNCKFIISHNSIYIYYMLYVMFIPHEMILKIFQVIYYYFHNHTKVSERDTHESWALLFVVPYTWHSWMPFISISSKATNMCSQYNQENKGEMKNFLLISLTLRLLQTHKSLSHVLRNCCSCLSSSILSFATITTSPNNDAGQNFLTHKYVQRRHDKINYRLLNNPINKIIIIFYMICNFAWVRLIK